MEGKIGKKKGKWAKQRNKFQRDKKEQGTRTLDDQRSDKRREIRLP